MSGNIRVQRHRHMKNKIEKESKIYSITAFPSILPRWRHEAATSMPASS